MSNTNSSSSFTIKDQATLDLHKIMLEAMRSRESDILHFVGFLLPAILGFFAATWWQKGEGNEKIFLVIFAITILILFFGAWYALALSYNYRYIQLVTWSLQKHLDLEQFEPNWEPKRFTCGNLGLFSFAPEILRAQLLLFLALVIAAAFVAILLMSNCKYLLVIWGETIVCVVIILVLGYCCYPQKYNKYREQVLEKSK